MKIKTFGGFLVILCAIISLSCACRGRGRQTSNSGAQSARQEVKTYGYRVKNVYPHDPEAFTQGLYWHDGYLWESTGLEGKSQMRKVELETGRVLKSTSLDAEYFGEGAVYLKGRIYQLTWQNGVAFVYDAETLERVAQFRYPGEGWGLATDGEMLYMSDSSAKIIIVDPEDFSRKKSITVRMDHSNKRGINEMEWIDGRIWANVYLTDSIVIINPETGKVEGVLDLGGILPTEEWTATTDVLNGIAYDPEGKRIFVTGKNWPKLFEIEIVEK